MKTAYKVFVQKNGELYPPMVANPNGEPTPIGKWVKAVASPIIGETKTGRPQVQCGGKGTSKCKSGTLAYRPGWHCAEIPVAEQFLRKDGSWPENFVWAEVEYEDGIDYQEQAMSYGYTENGKFRHAYAGLPYVPKGGFYRYRTNPNTQTAEWIITGGIRVLRVLTNEEVEAILKGEN